MCAAHSQSFLLYFVLIQNPDDPDTVDIIMQNLDQDHNKKVEFTEYLLMIFKLARACNKIISKDYCQASGSKQRGHSHQDQEEQSETEEDEGQKSSSCAVCPSRLWLVCWFVPLSITIIVVASSLPHL